VAIWHFWSVEDSTALRIWIVSAAVPGLMVLLPRLVGHRLLDIGPDDGRLVLMEATAGLLVGLRSLAAMGSEMLPQAEMFQGSLFMGLAGFGVFATSFPIRFRHRSWFENRPNGGYVTLGLIAAVVFVWTRNDADIPPTFVFSPASVSGAHNGELIAVALVAVLGFIKSPWRQPVALVLGLFALTSYSANVLAVDGSVLPWPNPVTALCCFAMLFPWARYAGTNHDIFE
jgi:hypothetical protein